MRYAAKVDANHVPIVEALRARGWSVLSLAALGKGVPDVLAHRQGVWRLCEIKVGKNKLNEKQQRFAAVWPVTVLRSVDDALELR
jgi:Holliday junction resolvase